MRAGKRSVKLFRIGRNQAVRIPVEFELPGTNAVMFRDGNRIMIEPVHKHGIVALLDSWEALDEVFPEIDDSPPEPQKIF